MARVWLLLGGNAGDNAQICALARRLDYGWEEKTLLFNGLYRLPNGLKGASRISLKRGCADALRPPWPDLVIGAGRRSVPVARWIRRASGGAARLVQIGRPQVASGLFDLVVTTPQYRIPADPRVIELPLPLTGLTRAALKAAKTDWAPEFKDLRRPLIAVSVGGDTSTCRLSAGIARELAELARDYARARKATLLVSTSRRTSEAAYRALRDTLPDDARLHRWRGRGRNPYLGYLAHADEIVVTDDSASMIADAALAARPLWLFPVPFKARNAVLVFQDRLFSVAERRAADGRAPGPAARVIQGLADQGWLSPPRRMERLVSGLLDQGHALRFSRENLAHGHTLKPGRANEEAVSLAVARIRELMAVR